MSEDDVLYHGTQETGLRVLEPRASPGYDKKYVYATDNLFNAVVFLSRKRNSLQASWDTDAVLPYFCERIEGVFDRWYSGVGGSIYVLPKGRFHRDERLGSHEFVSESGVAVLEEISIKDAKGFLRGMQRDGKGRIILYNDRRSMFPDDSDLVDMCMRGLKKYSLEFTLQSIRRLNPSLEAGFMARYERPRSKKPVG